MRLDRMARRAAAHGMVVVLVACSGATAAPEPTGSGPVVVAAFEGGEQIVEAGARLPSPLVAVARRDAAPAPGVAIEWRGPAGSGFEPRSSTSGTNGRATTTATLPAGASGPIVFEATAPGSAAPPATFTTYAVPAGAVVVDVRNNEFVPATVTVPVGTTVAWVWKNASNAHNVEPDDRTTPTRSGPVRDGPAVYTYTFTRPGTWRYFCLVHGDAGGLGMAGVVVVR